MSFLRKSTRLISALNYIGGSQNTNVQIQVRHIKRWVGPTLRELRARREKFNSEVYTARNTYVEWNYNAEIFAFAKRLNENFDVPKLQRAFVCRSYIIQEELRQKELGIEEPKLDLEDNKSLVEIGEKCISDYVQSYLHFSLPKCPRDGILSIFDWLTSEEMLANISSNIGTKDLILCANNTPDNSILRDAFVAVIGALAESSGETATYTFIRDFICTQLNQKDLSEIWEIQNPLDDLKKICNDKKLGEPEPRLIGANGTNTVLAVYNIGIYCNKKMIGKGFGESINEGIDVAALDALRKFYGISENMKPFNFEIQLEQTKTEKQVLKNN